MKLDADISNTEEILSPTYSLRYFTEGIPKYKIPDDGMPANATYQLVRDELNLDGNAAFDLGSFTTTWMEPEVEKLILENLGKNFVDRFEYPQTTEIHQRIVNMLGHLFNAPEQAEFCGTATIGSSEAIHLGLLAHKWTWKKRRIKEDKSLSTPNIIFGADAHVCWDKFAKYFEVEPRIIPIEKNRFFIDAESVRQRIDENTICVGVIMGTTFTGACEPVKEINDLLVQVAQEKGWYIPIHVDAASAGFVLPFVNPELEWDFRLSHVRSINVSGHKFGLVYPGLGWLIFKDKSDLPGDLIFYVNYLGDTMPTFTLNFSRSSDMILAQYYNLLRLGHSGYRRIINNCLENAKYLSNRLVESGRFELLSNLELPIVTFKFKEAKDFTPFQLARKLRERGWMLPAYNLPNNASDLTVMRVVIRETFSRDMAESLCSDIINAYDTLDNTKKKQLQPTISPRRGHYAT
ncbi:glutamate decarboxylase [Desulfotomaculum copahuensis]|uniref:glutamate decarboxylase n=1 Tax=Desulfotomaculum copahuensis TaxID=1838280 RepID=UPI00191BAF57|nr:glutamate decarboxylase [Desulfotomaculum copahuensis]